MELIFVGRSRIARAIQSRNKPITTLSARTLDFAEQLSYLIAKFSCTRLSFFIGARDSVANPSANLQLTKSIIEQLKEVGVSSSNILVPSSYSVEGADGKYKTEKTLLEESVESGDLDCIGIRIPIVTVNDARFLGILKNIQRKTRMGSISDQIKLVTISPDKLYEKLYGFRGESGKIYIMGGSLIKLETLFKLHNLENIKSPTENLESYNRIQLLQQYTKKMKIDVDFLNHYEQQYIRSQL